jgi:TldD protein
MDLLQQTDELFFTRTNLDLKRTGKIVRDALSGGDDGELFLEMRHAEMLAFDDGRLKTASYDQSSGFGLRAVAGEAHGYAHAGELSEAALKRAADSVSAVTKGYSGNAALAPSAGANNPLYSDQNPLNATSFDTKIKLLQEIDAYARDSDSPDHGRPSRSCVPTVFGLLISAPWCGSISGLPSNRTAGWNRAVLVLVVGLCSISG